MTARKKATTGGVLDGVDLVEFARLKAEVQQKASQALAERVERIQLALEEMKAIVDATGVGVNISELVSEFEDAQTDLDPNRDWDSSSAYC